MPSRFASRFDQIANVRSVYNTIQAARRTLPH